MGLTCVVMVVVVFVWLAYFNNLLQGFTSATIPRTDDRTSNGVSRGNNPRDGLASIPETLGKGIRNLFGFFGEPRTYRIEPSPESRQ